MSFHQYLTKRELKLCLKLINNNMLELLQEKMNKQRSIFRLYHNTHTKIIHKIDIRNVKASIHNMIMQHISKLYYIAVRLLVSIINNNNQYFECTIN